MEKNKQDEKKKDEILQAINDALELEQWGSLSDRLNVEVILRGRFQYEIKVTKHTRSIIA